MRCARAPSTIQLMYAVISALTFAFFVFTLVDVIRRDSSLVKFLPKLVWVFVVILIPLLGGILWWTLGRDYGERVVTTTKYPERMANPAPRPVERRSTEQQLADLEREEREERLRAEIARKRRERGLES